MILDAKTQEKKIFIKEKGFKSDFIINKNKEKYHVDINLIEHIDDSSESDSNVDSDCADIENTNSEDDNLNLKMINDGQMLKNSKNKISISLSNKETNDQEKEISSNNIYLLNKLIKLKEHYNQLIEEKYQLTQEKEIKLKKIKEAKRRINKKNEYIETFLKTVNIFDYKH